MFPCLINQQGPPLVTYLFVRGLFLYEIKEGNLLQTFLKEASRICWPRRYKLPLYNRILTLCSRQERAIFSEPTRSRNQNRMNVQSLQTKTKHVLLTLLPNPVTTNHRASLNYFVNAGMKTFRLPLRATQWHSTSLFSLHFLHAIQMKLQLRKSEVLKDFFIAGPSSAERAASSDTTQHWCRPLYGVQSSHKMFPVRGYFTSRRHN